MSEDRNENKLQEKARGAAQVVKETGASNQPVAQTGGKDAGDRKVRVAAARNSKGVNFPDGEGGLIKFESGKQHTVPAELADAVDEKGYRYFSDVSDDEEE